MYLYNSLTRKKEKFVPNEPGKVSMYTCGPTVYNFAHIGNLRSYIMEDILERALSYSGLEVKRVMNITDVGHLTSDADEGEDKMLGGAKRERKTVMDIAKFYTDAFFEDCKKLNIKIPEIVVPATSCIEEFIELISSLIEKGYAYAAGGNIYFDTAKIDKYHVFHDFKEEDLEVGVREGVGADTNKRNKADFVLWFTKSKFDDQELKWESPWGLGYPGWHIECSAISMKHLGDQLDIHCGGIDNAFPHHTNEIAQSEAHTGKKWCNFWFHVLHLNISGGKMSKSKGEFLTVSLLESKGYDPLVYRFFCLLSHYRKSLVFSYESLDNASAAYGKLAARIAQLLGDEGAKTENEDEKISELRKVFGTALEADLNTAAAITVLYDVLKAEISAAAKLGLIEEFDGVLCVGLIPAARAVREKEQAAAKSASEVESDPFTAEIREKIAERLDAKKAKNFARADEIRAELLAKGVTLIDTPAGTEFKIGG